MLACSLKALAKSPHRSNRQAGSFANAIEST